MSPLIWGRQFVWYTFDIMLSLWDARNKTGHQYNSNNDSILIRQRLVDQICALKESNPNVLYHAWDFIYCPIEDLEKFSVSNLTAWHNAACSIIKIYKLKQKKNASRSAACRSQFWVNVSAIPISSK